MNRLATVGAMHPLIAEDLLLLLLDDESGSVAAADKIQPLLGGGSAHRARVG